MSRTHSAAATLVLAAVLAAVLAVGCSRPVPPPTPESSADNAAASAPNGVGATRDKLPDPVNDGKPTAQTAPADAARPSSR